MNLSRAQIQYLLTIYAMLEKGSVRLQDIAQALQVSKPSVHGMEEQFVRLGLLEKKRYASVQMTELGKEVVKEYRELLQLLSDWLENSLSLPFFVAQQSALVLLGEWDGQCRQQIFRHLCQGNR